MMGRIASIECLKLSHWDPVRGVEAVVGSIREMLERWGRLDLESARNDRGLHPEGAYTDLEHLLMRLGLLTEMAPRANDKYPDAADADAAAGGRKRRRSAGGARADAPPPPPVPAADTAAGRKRARAADAAATRARARRGRAAAPPRRAAGAARGATAAAATAAGRGRPRAPTARPEPPPLPAAAGKPGKSYWAKGTGYGHNDAEGKGVKWDVEAYPAAQQEKDRLVEGLLHQIFLFLGPPAGSRPCSACPRPPTPRPTARAAAARPPRPRR